MSESGRKKFFNNFADTHPLASLHTHSVLFCFQFFSRKKIFFFFQSQNSCLQVKKDILIEEKVYILIADVNGLMKTGQA